MACACAPSREATPPPAHPAPSAPPDGTGLLAFDQTGGDVWAWSHRTAGKAADRCQRVALERGPTRVLTEVRDDRFSAQVPLGSGANLVKATCLGPLGGAIGDISLPLRVRLDAGPAADIRVVIVDEGIALDAGASRTAAVDASPLISYEWVAAEDNPAPLRLTAGEAPFTEAPDERRVIVAVPERDGEYFVTLRVTDAAGRSGSARTYFVVDEGEARTVDMEHDHPEWVDQAVVYGVVAPLFGGLDGVTDRLDVLDEVGVNVLWLTPVFQSPEDDFGYAVTGHFDVRAEVGGTEALRRLVEEAHRRGIRVILDFVPNHTSDLHPYFRDTLDEGRRSRYWDFYDRTMTGQPTHYFGWGNLPNLEYDNPEVHRWMIEVASYWVRELDVDGFRVDVAWGVRARAPEFWPRFREELKRIKPDVLLLAEATARDPYYFDDGFDAAYDWTWELGEWAWKAAFHDGRVDVDALHAALTVGGEGFPDDALVFRFLNNNDTGPRFRDRHGVGLERAAATLLFTLPGLPSIFTGDEVGASYEPYRRTRPLELEGRSIVPFYARLIELRRNHPALRSTLWEPVEVRSDQPAYAYLRLSSDTGQRLLVVINFAGKPQRVRVNAAELPAFRGKAARDVLHDEAALVRRHREDWLEVSVPAHDGRVLVLPPSD